MSAKNISQETDTTIKTFFKSVFGSTNLDQVYDEYATQYDELTNIFQYQGYKHVADELLKLFKEDASSKLVLDAGSGTGLVGGSLAEKGFKHIHALDISKASLDEAEKKNVYEKFILSGVTNEPTPGIAETTYDAVVSSGCFVPGHIKMNALEELCRITKQGGYIVITIRDPNFEMDFMDGLNQIMVSGKAELQSMKLIPYKLEYSENYEQKNAYLVVLKVTHKRL